MISLRKKFAAVEISDTGKVRDHNEDAIGSNRDAGLFVLADGMGGYNAGEVASSIAVKTILELATEACTRENRGETESETGMMRQTIVLRDAISRANKIIHQTANSQESCHGMGTTIVTCLFYDNKISIAHVGDSRMYRMREGNLEQITMDHSLLQELVDRGFYSKEEALRSTNKNYVTRALGVESSVDVELNEAEVVPGDFYLLCSDGLSDMVEDDDIQLTISTFHANLDVVGQQLIRLSNDQGGRDNISLMLAYIAQPFPARKGLLGNVLNWFNSSK